MDQQGNVPGSGIQTIDQLRYNYEDNGQSKPLLKAGDAMPGYGTGDFVNANDIEFSENYLGHWIDCSINCTNLNENKISLL